MIILSFTLLAFEQKTPITGKRAHTSIDYGSPVHNLFLLETRFHGHGFVAKFRR